MTSLSQIEAIFAPAIKRIEAMNIKAHAVLADVADVAEVQRDELAERARQACAEKARRAYAANDQAALVKQIKSNPDFWL